MVEQCPRYEASALAHQHPKCHRNEPHAVETECDGEYVADEWYPRQQGYDGSVAVDKVLLAFETCATDVQAFYPLPFADATYGVGGQSAEPVARRGDGDGGDGIGSCGEHTD